MVSDAPSADAGAAGSGEPLAIICGGGSFPGAVAEAIKRRGRRPVMFPVRGWADPKVVERYPHHWIAIGQAGRFFRLARAEGCREAVFIGQRAAEHRRVVGVQDDGHARVVQSSYGMLVEALHHARDQVAGNADLERDIALPQVAHQIGIADGGDAVANPLSAQIERCPNRFRPNALASVRR